MATVSTDALALRRTPFGETSQIVEFLTRDHGRLSLILKGVHRERSQMGGSVDLLDHARVSYFARRGSRSMALLRERHAVRHHAGLRSREDLLAAGLWLVELLQSLAPEGQAVPAMFDLATAFLEALDARPSPAQLPLIVLALEAGLLRMTGFQPVLDRCVSCDKRPSGHKVLRCDLERGGIVCSACREPEDASFPLGAAAAQLVDELAVTDPREIRDVLPTRIENDLRRFHDRTWTHVLERRPRVAAVFARES
jgi:DNA repair protein RecO (recombination protein O)